MEQGCGAVLRSLERKGAESAPFFLCGGADQSLSSMDVRFSLKEGAVPAVRISHQGGGDAGIRRSFTVIHSRRGSTT